MATPHGQSNSSGDVNSGPSRTLLQRLLQEINERPAKRLLRDETSTQSPGCCRSRFSSQTQSPSVWVGGSPSAPDARDKLREADEARRQMTAANAIDGAPDLKTSPSRPYPSGLELQITTHCEEGGTSKSTLVHTPDPVGRPHDYIQHMMKSSPLSMTVGQSLATQGHDDSIHHRPVSPLSNTVLQPLSPLMFSDVWYDDCSSMSPQTGTTASPTEIPPSATTTCTLDAPRTPFVDGTHKRTYHFADSTPEASPQKRRALTLPDIRGDAYPDMALDVAHCFSGKGGYNRGRLQDTTFTERAPTSRAAMHLHRNDELPQLSSFRPSITETHCQPQYNASAPRLTSPSTTSPVESASPAVPDTPAWMRPMRLIDIGGKSIYMNVHDDGPIRHALCLYCFRTHNDFRKVHRHGYELCGRTEVLDSHYWESDTLLANTSDDSSSSDC